MSCKQILVLTNSEHGLANAILATVHELLRLDPSLRITVASFAPLAAAVDAISAPPAAPPVFRALAGPSMTEALLQREPRYWERIGQRITPATVWSVMRCTTAFFVPWDAAEWVAVYRQLEEVVDDVGPHYAIVDPMFGPGLTICRARGIRHISCAPNTLKDAALSVQPYGQGYWKYPAYASGFPYPVPWYLVPLNICYLVVSVGLMLLDRRYARQVRAIERSGIKAVTNRDLMTGRAPGRAKTVLGCRREIDFPLSAIPDDVVACGPIVKPAPPLAETDPELARWLARGPTVLVSLGTLAVQCEDEAVQMAGALRMLLRQDKAGRHLQVLWKLKKKPHFDTGPGSRVGNTLASELKQGRVRIVDWIRAEPISVLQSGHIVCSVNHGGASSYNEAITAGIPQVILPVWADTYDYANRVEWLDIGRWGSRRASPRVAAAELGPILVDVIFGDNAARYRTKVRELADVCASYGDGRCIAARAIIKDMESHETVDDRVCGR